MDKSLWMAVLLAAFGWGTGGVATRSLLLHEVDPFTLISVRFVASALFLVAWLLWRRNLTSTRGAWLAGIVIGTVNMSAPTVFFTVALEYISAGLGGLMITLVPVVTAAWAHLLLVDERLTVRKLAGSGVAFAGVAVLIAAGETGFSGGSVLRGVAFSLLGVLLASLGGVLSRIYTQRYSVSELAGPQFVAGAIGAVVVGVVLGSTRIASIGPASWSLLAYLATVGTVLPYIGFLWVVQHTTATRASLVGYIVPLISLLVGAALLGEQINLIIAASAMLIIVGVVIVDRADTTRPVQAA